MYNEKLLRSALKYEVQNADQSDVICKILFEMGVIDKPDQFLQNSTAMCFEESNPPAEQIITLLNGLGYNLEQQAA